MNGKRLSAILLGIMLVLTVFAGVFQTTAARSEAKESIVINDYSPAILADVGEKIVLGDYALQIGEELIPASDLTWKNGTSVITEIEASEKGVLPLTASYDDQTKNVYLIAKDASESEYVLYENDFSGTKQDLLDEGWVFFHTDTSNYTECSATVSDGWLHLGSRSDGYARAILPPFIGDFSTYSVEAVATQTDCTDGGRWCSIVYHGEDKIRNGNNWFYPYYHMCVRNNTTNNTIEFAERTSSDAWNVITTMSRNMTMAQPHTLKISCFDNVVQYFFDGESIFFTSNAGAHNTGYAGLTSNYGVMNVDSVRVTLLQEKPSRPPEKPVLIETSANRPASNIANYVSVHAYVTRSNDDTIFQNLNYPVAAMVELRDDPSGQSDFEDLLNYFKEHQIIPEFRLSEKSQVDLLQSAILSTGVPEAVVIGSAEVVKYARNKNKTVLRGILDKADITSFTSLYDLYNETVGAYAQGILLPADLATKENVAELQEYELAVWAFKDELSNDTDTAWLLASGANAVVTSSWEKVNEAQTSLLTGTNVLTRTPVWTAHRGNFVTYPENSISAYRSAIEEGADCVETDVYLTKDGEIVILHDGTLDRTSNGTGNVSSMTLAEIQKYKLKNTNGSLSNETFPTFRELLELCKGKDIRILCELKSSEVNLTKKCVDLIKEYKMETQVVFISFNATQLDRAKTHLNVTTGYLLSGADGVQSDDVVGTLNSYAKFQKSCLEHSSTMAIAYPNITDEFLRDANDRGLTLWSWTYTNGINGTVCTNFLAGMNGMTTNYISYLKNTVKTILPSRTHLQLKSGGTETIKLEAFTYLQKALDITKDVKTKVQLLDNDGVIKYEKGTITGLKSGSASILLSYETKLPNGKLFTLYTQPVRVFVDMDDPYQTAEIGDVNGNGEIDGVDYLLVKKYVLGTLTNYTAEMEDRMDVNRDGEIDAIDYMALKKYVLTGTPLPITK